MGLAKFNVSFKKSLEVFSREFFLSLSKTFFLLIGLSSQQNYLKTDGLLEDSKMKTQLKKYCISEEDKGLCGSCSNEIRGKSYRDVRGRLIWKYKDVIFIVTYINTRQLHFRDELGTYNKIIHWQLSGTSRLKGYFPHSFL